MTDSEGDTVDNPRYYRTSQRTLRRKQRTMCRRKKGSHRRRKAARNVAKTHLKIKRQRRDHHFKTARPYADSHSVIVVEDLNICGMVKNQSLAKSISDAGWGQFLDILSAKAANAGHRVIRVKIHFTLQKCFRCGEIVQKSLSVRTHICPFCGYIADRDTNAAQNILKRGLGQDMAFGRQRTGMPDAWSEKPLHRVYRCCHKIFRDLREKARGLSLVFTRPAHFLALLLDSAWALVLQHAWFAWVSQERPVLEHQSKPGEY